MTTTLFFSKNKDIILQLTSYISNIEQKNVAEAIITAATEITNSISKYDNRCTLIPLKNGKQFLRKIGPQMATADIPYILFFLTACVKEVTESEEGISEKEQRILDFFMDERNHSELEWRGFLGYYTNYINVRLPLHLANQSAEETREIRASLVNIKQDAEHFRSQVAIEVSNWRKESAAFGEKTKEDVLSELKSITDQIAGHKDLLKNLSSEYNFIGLSGAFQNMLKNKSRESNRYFTAVIFIGILTLTAPVLIAYFANSGALNSFFTTEWSAANVLKLIGLTGFEIILLYYFRISLRSFLLIKEQHSNLSLRLAMCQFIEGYADFLKRTKDNGSDLMKGFEILIFSPLPSIDGTLPATVDGLESIAKIVESLKSK